MLENIQTSYNTLHYLSTGVDSEKLHVQVVNSG